MLTGAQVMLLIASETGHVYSYATDKLKPIVQGTEGEQLVLSCLKTAQDNPRSDKQSHSKPIKMEVIPSLPTETVNGTVNSFKSRLDNSFAQSKIVSGLNYTFHLLCLYVLKLSVTADAEYDDAVIDFRPTAFHLFCLMSPVTIVQLKFNKLTL